MSYHSVHGALCPARVAAAKQPLSSWLQTNICTTGSAQQSNERNTYFV